MDELRRDLEEANLTGDLAGLTPMGASGCTFCTGGCAASCTGCTFCSSGCTSGCTGCTAVT